MAKKYKHIKDAIIRDVHDAAELICKQSASITRDILANEYELAIDMFYREYTPTKYRRTYNLYKGYVKYYKDSHGKFFSGGIRICTDRMHDEYFVSNHYVLDISMLGYHGFVNEDYHTNPPIERVYNKYERIFNNPRIWVINPAIERVKKMGYAHLFN